MNIETYEMLSCTTPQQRGSEMHGFDMPLDASIIAELAWKKRIATHATDEEKGIAAAIHNEIEWSATLAWEHFCGRR